MTRAKTKYWVWSAYATEPGSVFPGTRDIRSIRRFVIRALPDDTPALFHAAEVPQLILVREDLRARLAAASPFPGHFIAAEKYRDAI
jgi:hypothetical protein